MPPVVLLGFLAFCLCVLATPLVRNFSLWAKLVDHPDEKRKLHLSPVPRLGGVAIVLSYLGAFGLWFLLSPGAGSLLVQHQSFLLSVLPATGIVFLTGLADDLLTLRPWHKLAGQGIAAALAVDLGARVSLHHGPPWLVAGISFTLLIVYSNAINLIDGMDGLATGVALFATLSSLLVAILSKNLGLAVATVPLAACLLAFLRYNFHPASIFLGDCGSLTIGFMLGCFALTWSQHNGTVLGMVAPLLALALPLLDVTLAVLRRYLRGTPIFGGDRHHIHHKVLLRCLTTRRAVLALYGISGVTSVLALFMNISEHETKWAIVTGACALAILGVSSLQYVELTAAVRTLSYRALSKRIKEAIYLIELELELEKAHSDEAVWQIACSAFRHLGVNSLEMRLQETFRSIELEFTPIKQASRMSLSFGDNGELTFTHGQEDGEVRQMMAVLVCLRTSVEKKAFVLVPRHIARSVASQQGAA